MGGIHRSEIIDMHHLKRKEERCPHYWNLYLNVDIGLASLHKPKKKTWISEQVGTMKISKANLMLENVSGDQMLFWNNLETTKFIAIEHFIL